MSGDVRLTKTERRYLAAALDWSAPYEVLSRMKLSDTPRGRYAVINTLDVLKRRSLVEYGPANNTYRITPAGRQALAATPGASPGGGGE